MPITIFTIHKDRESSKKKFRSAFHCAVGSISSILYDHDCIIANHLPDVWIDHKEGNEIQSASHLLRIIEAAFVDSNNKLYPEFFGIEIRT